MSALETLTEGERAVHPGFLGERAQELDKLQTFGPVQRGSTTFNLADGNCH
jgi:hypothetical protein